MQNARAARGFDLPDLVGVVVLTWTYKTQIFLCSGAKGRGSHLSTSESFFSPELDIEMMIPRRVDLAKGLLLVLRFNFLSCPG